MIDLNRKEQIKELIKMGFGLDLISFQLDIPIEKLKKIQLEMQKSNQPQKEEESKKIVEDNIDDINKEAKITLSQMRDRYKAIYYNDNGQVNNMIEQSQIEKQEVDNVILEIEKIIELMVNSEAEVNRNNVVKIINQLQKLKNYKYTIEQAKKIQTLLETNEVRKYLRTDKSLTMMIYIKKIEIKRKLFYALDIAISNADDIESLKILQKEINTQKQKENIGQYYTLSDKIRRRISSIQEKNAINKVKNEVSENVQDVIRGLSSGTTDIEQIKQRIKQEAKQRVDSSPKTRFALTEEQQLNQILIQIRAQIIEHSNKYPIVNPEATLIQLRELFNGDFDSSIRTVVGNLIESKRFDDAKKLCEKYISKKNKENQIGLSIDRQMKLIKNAEIGDFILKVINCTETGKDERCLELIEKGLRTGNIKLKSIPLGKSQDGLKTITLDDIWEDKSKHK